jgi:ribonuclease-3
MKAARDWAESALGHAFADPALLRRALTHRSLGGENYERLEFLGDRVLGRVMAAWLFDAHPDEPEGRLNQRMSRLVSRETCAAVARRLGVPAHLRLGVQAKSDGGFDSDNILGDAMEALIGAIWLEAGDAATEALVRRMWAPLFDAADAPAKHPKSALQEWAAARMLPEPVYEMLKRSGPHHQPRFRVRLSVGGLGPVEAVGASKQEAETEAARRFLAEHAHAAHAA